MGLSIKKNLFITGAPSVGKTTVIKKVIRTLPFPANGFYTEERGADGKRSGFVLHTLDGKTGYLAHQDIASEHHIRRYGVSLSNIDAIAVLAINPIGNNIIILDEIGKMECFSPHFIKAASRALDSPNIVVGTITLGGTDYIQEVKSRSDIEIIEVSLENRDQLPEFIVQKVLEIYQRK